MLCCMRNPDEDELEAAENARDAVKMACQQPEGRMHGGDSGEYLILPWKVQWGKDALRSVHTIGTPLLFGATVTGYVITQGIAIETAAPIGAAVFIATASAFTDVFGKWSLAEAVRIGATQLTSQAIATYGLRYGLEQLAIYVNPRLGGYPASQDGTAMAGHTILGNGSLPVNGTGGGFSPDSQLQLDCYSLAVVGLPFAFQLLNMIFPVRGGTTAIDAAIDRVRFDGRPTDKDGNPRDVSDRLGEANARALTLFAKTAISGVALGLPIGFAATGQMDLAHKVFIALNSTFCAGRIRDGMNAAFKGATHGGLVTFQRPDDGVFRQIEIKIPKPVLDELRLLCIDSAAVQADMQAKEDNGELQNLTAKELENMYKEVQDNHLDKAKYEKAEKYLHDQCRDVFIFGRVWGSVNYALFSVGFLAAMRLYFAGPIDSVFANTFHKLIEVTLGAVIGTSIVEASEEPGHNYMVRALASWRDMPFIISAGPKDPAEQIGKNLKQLSTTAVLGMVPLMPLIRSLHESLYRQSTVSLKDGKVTISLSDSIELNTGARCFQNAVTANIFTCASAVQDPKLKLMLYLIAALYNGFATHYRGPGFVSQLLAPGLENRLRYLLQQALEGENLSYADIKAVWEDVFPERSIDDEAGDLFAIRRVIEQVATFIKSKGDTVVIDLPEHQTTLLEPDDLKRRAVSYPVPLDKAPPGSSSSDDNSKPEANTSKKVKPSGLSKTGKRRTTVPKSPLIKKAKKEDEPSSSDPCCLRPSKRNQATAT